MSVNNHKSNQTRRTRIVSKNVNNQAKLNSLNLDEFISNEGAHCLRADSSRMCRRTRQANTARIIRLVLQYGGHRQWAFDGDILVGYVRVILTIKRGRCCRAVKVICQWQDIQRSGFSWADVPLGWQPWLSRWTVLELSRVSDSNDRRMENLTKKVCVKKCA